VSLLTAAQAVMAESGLGPLPSTVIGNTDPGVVQLFYLLRRSSREIATRHNWQKLLRDQTITTVASQEGYALPSDWSRYVVNTAWDATNYWPTRGSLDPQLWNALKRGIVTAPQTRREFRLKGNSVLIYPTPDTNGDSLILEYARNTPWTDVTGVTYVAIPTADTDLFLLLESVLVLDTIWRLKRAKGFPYEDDRRDAENAVAVAYADDTPSYTLNDGITLNPTPQFLANVPQMIP
jgi:hypothetical protein